eukprot:4491952-Prymnesium_polylepis.1
MMLEGPPEESKQEASDADAGSVVIAVERSSRSGGASIVIVGTAAAARVTVCVYGAPTEPMKFVTTRTKTKVLPSSSTLVVVAPMAAAPGSVMKSAPLAAEKFMALMPLPVDREASSASEVPGHDEIAKVDWMRAVG